MGFGFLLYLQWEAMLISYLAKREITLPFNDMSSLVTKSDFKIAVIPGSSYEDAFKTATDPFWKKAWKERIEPYLEYYKPYYGDYLLYSIKLFNVDKDVIHFAASANYIDVVMQNPDIAVYANFIEGM